MIHLPECTALLYHCEIVIKTNEHVGYSAASSIWVTGDTHFLNFQPTEKCIINNYSPCSLGMSMFHRISMLLLISLLFFHCTSLVYSEKVYGLVVDAGSSGRLYNWSISVY